MSIYKINGKNIISGEMKIQGAKNSVLPILSATVLIKGKSVIHNCPDISDADVTFRILEHLGCKIKKEGHTVIVDAENIVNYDIPEDLMRENRSSVVFAGAVLGRTGKAEISSPGGCEIGLRPIDLHISSLAKFGVEISEEGSSILFDGENGLKGTDIMLSFPSVGATENIILTAVMAKGRTVITNAAREPEISDLSDFLNRCGAKICGAGEGTIIVDGVKSLHSGEHSVIPDRIAAVTYMTAAAMTHGRIRIDNIVPVHLKPVFSVFEEVGCDIHLSGHSVTLTAPSQLKAVNTVRTMPYPGFPTDLQAPVTAMLCIAKGTSVVIETIFESRFKYINELVRMGANVRVDGRMAVVQGVEKFNSANVYAPDLRGGSALVLAGLCADGTTEIENTELIKRGYENFDGILRSLGADIISLEKDVIYGEKQE